MADAKLTALTAASALAGADLFYVSQSAASRKATGTQLLALVGTAYVPLAGGTMTGALRISTLYTDSSNYERLTLTGVAGTSVNITAETLGTGGDNLDLVLTPAGTGRVIFPNGTIAKPGMVFLDSPTMGFSRASDNVMELSLNGARSYRLTTTGLFLALASTPYVVSVGGSFAWSSNVAGTDAIDTAVFRGAAGQVDVTNGTAATYRDLKLRNLIQTAYHEVAEMTAPAAPATNSVRIYAEDNGAGKTRLMALFATGSAVQLGIEP